MYEHHKSTACDIVASAPCFFNTWVAARMRSQNRIQSTGSVTTDSLRLQHTHMCVFVRTFLASATHTCVCVRAVTDHGLSSLLMQQTCVHVCRCMCVFARRSDMQPSHNHNSPPQYTCLRASATHICVKSVSLGFCQTRSP